MSADDGAATSVDVPDRSAPEQPKALTQVGSEIIDER